MTTSDLKTAAAQCIDLSRSSVRELNSTLHGLAPESDMQKAWRVVNPGGRHCIAAGLLTNIEVEVDGHAGYYCGGMNHLASIRVKGNAGVGLAENIMSGRVEVNGNVSQAAGATGRGGLVVIHGNASARCGISLKGADVVVGGSIGHMGGFMAQRGRIVVCGDAGDALGDSIYEAEIYVRGAVGGLGADCVEQGLEKEHAADLRRLLDDAGVDAEPSDFRRYGSARQLYSFHVDDAGVY